MGEHDSEPRRRPIMRGPGGGPHERPELDPDWVRGVRERGLDRDLERYHREPEPGQPPRRQPARPLPPPIRRPDRGTRGRGAERSAAPPDLTAAPDGPLLPAPWLQGPDLPVQSDPVRPGPAPPPLESAPPETVSSHPGPSPQPYHTPPSPPPAYYTPTPPPAQPPPPPIPWTPPPEPLTLAPDYTLEEAMRIGAEWLAEAERERARRRLEFFERYGVAVPTWVEGPDGPVLISGHPYPPPEPVDVLRHALRSAGELIVDTADSMAELSDDIRQELIDDAERLGERRGELGRRRKTLRHLLDHAVIFGGGIVGGVIRAVLELPSGIIASGEMVGRLLLLLYLEDLERGERHQARPDTPAWPGVPPGTHVLSLQDAEFLRLGLTPDQRQRLLDEQRQWFQRLGEGLRQAIDEWLDEYDNASSDQRMSMISQIIGEVIPALITGGRGGPPRGGRVVAEVAETAEHARRVVRAIPDGHGGLALELAPARSGAGVAPFPFPFRASPSPAVGTVLMSSALRPGDAPSTGPAASGASSGSDATRGTGTASRGASERGSVRRRPPRRRRFGTATGRRMSRAAYQLVAERLTRIEVEAARRARLVRQLRDGRRAEREAHGHSPRAQRLRERLARQERELMRRLGIAETSDSGLTEQIRRLQGLMRAMPEVRRTLRSADLDDAARRALRELDLDDHVAIAETARRVSRGHRGAGQPDGGVPRDADEAIRASDLVGERRAGVTHNVAGRIVEQVGRHAVDPRARAWATEQARRLGLADAPIRGRLRTWRPRRTPEGGQVLRPVEAGDIGVYASPSGDELILYVVPEAKSGAPATARQIRAMMRRLEREPVEFIADDGRRFRYEPGRTRSGSHTLLVTHGVADRAAPSFAERFVREHFGDHLHNPVPLTYEQARDIAARYLAAIPESRRAPAGRRFQPVPRPEPPPPPPTPPD